jgi:tripartite-type tricarboxylate transporter receptor subunit TctC
MLRSVVAIALALFSASMASSAGAQTYPTRPVRLIVPFRPAAATTLSRVCSLFS